MTEDKYKKAELTSEILGDTLTVAQKDMLTELTAKQRWVMILKMKGATQDQIATVMGVSQPAISKTLKRVRDHLTARGQSVNQSEVIGDNMSFYEEVEKDIWDIADTRDLEKGEKLKALQVLMSARKDRNKLLMDVGLLTVAPKETIHSVRSTPFIEAMRREKRVDEAVISAISTTHDDLEEPEPPQLEAGDDAEE